MGLIILWTEKGKDRKGKKDEQQCMVQSDTWTKKQWTQIIWTKLILN